ncbi:MAG: hypothetical protein QM644_02810 [Mobilitalea sp.]
MIFILIGIIGFLLLVVYDINSIIFKVKLLYSCFFVGSVLIIAATIGIVFTQLHKVLLEPFRMGVFGAISFLFFVLLIYTLFFALPFQNTYIETKQKGQTLQQEGIYAICRHPGVLWFIGFYLFLGLALMLPLLILAAFIFSFLNVLYIVVQDRWTFVRTFEGYEQYKKNTPFLIPNKESIKRCFETIGQLGRVEEHEI